MAYWQNGKLYMHCSTQSVMQTVDPRRALAAASTEDVVIISEYTGGGFGSKSDRRVIDGHSGAASKKATRR